MANYFGFIDETGVLHNDPDQRFFAIGLLKCDDTSALYEEFRILKNRAESKLDLERQAKGQPVKKGCFEFKFSSITRGSHEFYYDLISLYFKFPKLQFCSFVIDKTNPGVKIDEVFPDTWEAYIGYSKMLIKNNMNPDDKICVVADFLGKPKTSTKYYEPEIRSLTAVYNATVLESHASLFIQIVDVMIGCIVLDFKRGRQPERKADVFKGKVCDFLKGKLGLQSLARNFTNHQPNYFSVWEFSPK
ncbi:MAG: DUF3800 domain-containing protein [Candidatus Omnitrophota bacterium]